MREIMEAINLDQLDIHAADAELVTWQGRRALRLVNGLAVLPDLTLSDGHIEVSICAEEPCYPGIAFRMMDRANYELAYAQPHTSGLWDALQYDPVFHGSNTWQLYHGEPYQQTATVPMNEWFRLSADFQGKRAAFTLDDQPPLVVNRLSRSVCAGRIGLWTFQPAYFCDLVVSETAELPKIEGANPIRPAGVVDEWFVQGFGRVECGRNGSINLNRHLPMMLGEVTLIRQFETLMGGPVEIRFGFSDELTLCLDDQIVFEGAQTFIRSGPDKAERGYIESDRHRLKLTLDPGVHTIMARLKVTEYFGWGMILSLLGEHVNLLPVWNNHVTNPA